MDQTLTVSVQGSLWELLRALGEPSMIVPAALRQYVMDRCLQRIEEAEHKAAFYASRYGTDYEAFNRRVTTDQGYLDALNREHPLWEADAIEWLHRIEEATAWRGRLERALRLSSPSLVPA